MLQITIVNSASKFTTSIPKADYNITSTNNYSVSYIIWILNLIRKINCNKKLAFFLQFNQFSYRIS